MSIINEGSQAEGQRNEGFLAALFASEGSVIGLQQSEPGYFPTYIPLSEEELRTEVPLSYRLFEFILAALLAAAILPLALVVALLLKRQGHGSPLYRQVRVGKDGRNFTILKFRTMYEDAEAAGPFVCTTYDDARITPLGKFLRKSKIDELPQVWNILKGEMALVGPRPERPCFHEENLKIRDWEKRISVRPGLTGLAQISQVIAHDPEKKIVADMAYIHNRTFILDLQIIALTAFPKIKVFELSGIPLRRR